MTWSWSSPTASRRSATIPPSAAPNGRNPPLSRLIQSPRSSNFLQVKFQKHKNRNWEQEKKFVLYLTCKLCYHGKVLAQNGTCNESPSSPLHLQLPKYQNLMTVWKGAKANIRVQETPSDTKQTTPKSSLAAKNQRKLCNWGGVICQKKNNKDSSVSDKN